MSFVFDKNLNKILIQIPSSMLLQNSEIINSASKFLLALLFVYTGCSKLLGHELFVNQLSQMEFVKNFAPLISFVLPVLEIAAALFIAFESPENLGLWISSLLMTFFTIYVGGMLILKSSLPCTCGGVLASMSWRQHLYFNIFFTLVSWNALHHNYKKVNQIISTNKRK